MSNMQIYEPMATWQPIYQHRLPLTKKKEEKEGEKNLQLFDYDLFLVLIILQIKCI